MTRLDPRSERTSRRALVLARFPLAASIEFCSVGPPPSDPARLTCPSCRAKAPAILARRLCAGRRRYRVRELSAATSLHCPACGTDVDAIGYVMAAKNWASLDRALDQIERWQSGQITAVPPRAPVPKFFCVKAP